MTNEISLSRRGFLRASGMAAMGAGAVALVGCGPSSASTGDAGSSAEAGSSAAASSTFGESGKLRVGMEVAYPPYNWQVSEESEYTMPVDGQSGAYADGYDVVVAKKVAEAFDLEPVAVKLAWSGLIEALTSGQIDCIIAGMTATDERKESIDFSDPYFVGHYGLLVQSGSPYENATSLEDFSGASVLGQKDTLLDTVIDEIPGVNHRTPVDSVPSQLSQLNQGAVDAITYNTENVKGLLAANPNLVAVQFNGDYTLFPDEVPVNVGIAKGQDDVLAKINDVVNAIPEDEMQSEWDAVIERQPASA